MFAAIVSLCFVFTGSTLADDVDLWEDNQVANTGNVNLSQVVWWKLERHKDVTDYFVVAWRLKSDCDIKPQLIGGRYVGAFYDRKTKSHRVIRARIYMETVSTVDLEILDRHRLAESERSGLK